MFRGYDEESISIQQVDDLKFTITVEEQHIGKVPINGTIGSISSFEYEIFRAKWSVKRTVGHELWHNTEVGKWLKANGLAGGVIKRDIMRKVNMDAHVGMHYYEVGFSATFRDKGYAALFKLRFVEGSAK